MSDHHHATCTFCHDQQDKILSLEQRVADMTRALENEQSAGSHNFAQLMKAWATVDRLTEALEPFAKAADEVLSCGCGGDGHAVRMDPGHWRAARAALASGESKEGEGK